MTSRTRSSPIEPGRHRSPRPSISPPTFARPFRHPPSRRRVHQSNASSEVVLAWVLVADARHVPRRDLHDILSQIARLRSSRECHTPERHQPPRLRLGRDHGVSFARRLPDVRRAPRASPARRDASLARRAAGRRRRVRRTVTPSGWAPRGPAGTARGFGTDRGVSPGGTRRGRRRLRLTVARPSWSPRRAAPPSRRLRSQTDGLERDAIARERAGTTWTGRGRR